MSQALQLYECFSLVNSTISGKMYFSLVVISADVSLLLIVLIKGSDKSEKCIAKFHKLHHTQSKCIKKKQLHIQYYYITVMCQNLVYLKTYSRAPMVKAMPQ